MPVGEPIYLLVVFKMYRMQKAASKIVLQAVSQHTLVMRMSMTVDQKNTDTGFPNIFFIYF